MHRVFMWMKWRRTQWIILSFMVSGAWSEVTVHQPPVLTTVLGHDVTMPCRLSLSQSEKMAVPPVLYWYFTQHSQQKAVKVWHPPEEYMGRVSRLDSNRNSTDVSILLKKVQWADSGSYLCKVSVTAENDERFRRKGNETLLVVYDTMMFDISRHSDSLLRCEVNVSQDHGFVLSIFYNGTKVQAADSAPGEAVKALPYVRLSETISLRSEGQYECQLHLDETLITKRIFCYHLTGGDAGKNASGTCSTAASDVMLPPEPWFLYVPLLLVPVIIQLVLITALLTNRC